MVVVYVYEKTLNLDVIAYLHVISEICESWFVTVKKSINIGQLKIAIIRDYGKMPNL